LPMLTDMWETMPARSFASIKLPVGVETIGCINPANTCNPGCDPTERTCSVQCTYYDQSTGAGQWAPNDWEAEQRAAVALGRTFASRYCSGSFINNVGGRQLVLTAAHCGPSASDIVLLNFHATDCESADDNTGDTSRSAGDIDVLSSSTRIDNELIEIGENLPANWNVYLSGYEAGDEDNAAPEVVGIHHPSGGNKKISHAEVTVEPDSWSGAGAQDHWRVSEWTEATTEPGSSGSPLYNQRTRRIIGQLHGGSAACPAGNGYDTYGAVWAGYENMAPFLGPLAMDGAELNTVRKN